MAVHSFIGFSGAFVGPIVFGAVLDLAGGGASTTEFDQPMTAATDPAGAPKRFEEGDLGVFEGLLFDQADPDSIVGAVSRLRVAKTGRDAPDRQGRQGAEEEERENRTTFHFDDSEDGG